MKRLRALESHFFKMRQRKVDRADSATTAEPDAVPPGSPTPEIEAGFYGCQISFLDLSYWSNGEADKRIVAPRTWPASCFNVSAVISESKINLAIPAVSEKPILRSVSGVLNPGHMTAIMVCIHFRTIWVTTTRHVYEW
jgi:hypothetical protein